MQNARVPLRVSHTVASIHNRAAGPSYSVPRLAVAQAQGGIETELLTLGDTDDTKSGSLTIRRFAQNFRHVPLARDFGVSIPMWRALKNAARTRDIIHTHGLWLAPNILPGLALAGLGECAKFVCAPRGMLGAPALKFSSTKKKLMWTLVQGSVARRVDCWHATAASEYEDIRAVGLSQPIAIVPNGVDIPDLPPTPRALGKTHSILSLGRLHPKKGLERLLLAWSKVEAAHPDWRLDIVGPAELGHDHALRALANELGLTRVHFGDAVFGKEKLAALAGADLFVLPTLHENFAMTVAEALAAGTPTISTKGAPWAGLETERCGWWVDHGVDPLAAALDAAMATPKDELRAMGQRGRAWMSRDFSWDQRARELCGVYSWLKSGGAPPAALHVH